MKIKWMGVLILLALMTLTWSASAQTTASAPAAPAGIAAAAPAVSTVNSGDTAWVLMSTALVLLMMIPGLAFFYGGLVRRKNVLSVLMQCFFIMCVISIQWVLFGYSLAFGPDVKGLIGNLSWAGLTSVGMEPFSAYAATIPHQVFMLFQMMFAVITPGLIIGAFAERMKFTSFVVFTLLWATLVYDPVCHWVWGLGGFLSRFDATGNLRPGALDFAGGTVVHINAGMAALAAALLFGKRQGYPHGISPPHNLPIAALGAALLWFGWFGFNAGSALAANGVAVNAFLATHVAGCVAGVTWCALDWIKFGKPTTLGIITGVVAGLAAVTPAAGYIETSGAVWIGLVAAILCWIAVTAVKAKLRYDDTLDAFGVHGVAGIWGSLAVGLWATKAVNPHGVDGLFAGNPVQLWIQTKAVLISAVYSFVVSLVLLKFVDLVIGLRVTDHEERIGLDLTQHREASYTVLD